MGALTTPCGYLLAALEQRALQVTSLPLRKCRGSGYMTWSRLSIQGSLVGVMGLSGDKDLMCSQLSSPGWGLPDVPLPLEPPAAQGLGLMLSLLHLGCQTEGGYREGIPESQDAGEDRHPAPSGPVTGALATHMPYSRLEFRSPLSWERPWASELWRQPEDRLSLASTFSIPALWVFTAPLEARPGHSRG